MDRIHSIKNKKNYYLWLNKLRQKLIDYKPLFVDLDKRRNASFSFNYSKYNLQGKIWAKINQKGFSRYEVSNLGRVKYIGKIVPQKNETKNGKECIGYLVLDKKAFQDKYPNSPCGFTQHIYVYTLVALAFLGKIYGDGYHVHHITNDGYDNSVNNLVLLTAIEHSMVHRFK